MADQRTHLTRPVAKNKPLVISLSILAIILAAILVVWINLPWRPDVTPFHTDSGFYAYFGKAILHGEVPYRDVWDDKPPLGYYLNALGLAIFGQNSWGVWWAGVVWIFGCTVLFFMVIKKLFGNLTAGIASTLFLLALMNPQLFEGANLMEVYALAPQIAIIGITFLFFTNQRHYWFAILVGFVTAFSFLIKQPTIVLGGVSLMMMIISS
ncbi:MAG TPA: glycosyltransferase family 39 protein, partial [Anaerolineales bacterium]